MLKSRPFQQWTQVLASILATSATTPEFCRLWRPWRPEIIRGDLPVVKHMSVNIDSHNSQFQINFSSIPCLRCFASYLQRELLSFILQHGAQFSEDSRRTFLQTVKPHYASVQDSLCHQLLCEIEEMRDPLFGEQLTW